MINRAERLHASADEPNPLYIERSTGRTFRKYETDDIGSATTAELITIEYLSCFVLDSSGTMWLLSEEERPIVRMTPLYLECMVGESEHISPLEERYERDDDAFQTLLQTVRAESQLREEAHRWAESILGTGANGTGNYVTA